MTEQNTLSLLPSPTLKRCVASMIYEGLLLFGVGFFSSAIFLFISKSTQGKQLVLAHETFLFICFGIYFIYFWTKTGQTLAMQTWRIKLVDNENKTLSLKKAFVRYLFAWTWFVIGYLIAKAFGLTGSKVLVPILIALCFWVAFPSLNPRRQFLHDLITKTKLVQLPSPSDLPR